MTYKQKYLDYNNGTGELPEGAFRISASQFNNFMTRPHLWFREHVLGEEGDFKGNTSSVIGTIVHAIAASYVNGDEVDKEAIEDYVYEQANSNEDVDPDVVLKEYPAVAHALMNHYVVKNTYTEVEPFVSYNLIDNVYPSGSIDAIQGSMIIDYKTYNSKTKPTSIPMNYKYQLLIYAYILTKQGRYIDRIRLVYVNREIDGRYTSDKTGKLCGKIHPAEVTVLTEVITQEDLDFIESTLLLCAETYQQYKKTPELAYLLYRDYRLKGI